MDAEEITKKYPMDDLLTHRFPPIRWIERARRNKLVEFVKEVDPHKIIVVLGCERGHTISDLHKAIGFNKSRFFGLDISQFALDKAKERAITEGYDGNSTFFMNDVNKICLKDNFADVVICSNLLEHLEDPKKCFKESLRILKPDGRLIVVVPFEKLVTFAKRCIKPFGLLGNLKVHTEGHIHKGSLKFLGEVAEGTNVDLEKVLVYPFIYIFAIFKKK